MPNLDRWIIGALMGIVAIIGLYMASKASDDVMYFTGLILFIVGVLFNFIQINRIYNAKKQH